MADLIITLDDLLLDRARAMAREHGTSVETLLREYLEAYAGSRPTYRALAGFAELAERTGAGEGGAGRTWTREELHERP